MIVETIFSTLDAAGQPNFAPMGIIWGEDEVVIQPYKTTTTFRNLIATRYGVANLTDDVSAFVQSALYDAVLPHFPASVVPGVVFQGTCSWLELEALGETVPTERAKVRCRVVNRGSRREFLGFCRARNAVIEAAILATRLHLYDPKEVTQALGHYEQIVRKTGDETERVALQRVCEFVGRYIGGYHG